MIIIEGKRDSAPTRWTAHFQPEAWVNNEAVAIDGAVDWDATAYITDPEGASESLWHQAVGLQQDRDFVDRDDELRNDPNAPAIVREHTGPFTIRVRASA